MIVEESGEPIAALVSLQDLVRLDQIHREREAAFAVIDCMRAAFADVSPDEIESEIAKAIAEVRAEMDAERVAPGQAE